MADCMQEMEEAMLGFLTQPAKAVFQDGRDAVPKGTLPQSVLNEQTQVSAMMPTAGKKPLTPI